MNCAKCGAEIPDGMSFCGKCGEKIPVPSVGKGPVEITSDWLKSVLETEGFEVEIDSSDSDSLVATHEKRPNQLIQIKRELGIVSLQSPWTMKKLGWGGKDALYKACNDANSASWYSTFYANIDANRITSSFYIQLGESVSEGDVRDLLEKVEADFFRIVNSSGLVEYLG